MKCPNCGNMIESFKCNECGFDIKKSRLLSAMKFDASEISSINEYIRVEDERIAKEEKRRSDKAKEEAERKRAEEREHYEQDDKCVLETFYQSYSKIFEKYSDADGYLVGLREAYNGKNLQDVYDECLSFYDGAYQRLASEVVGLADNAKEQLHSDKSKAEIDNQITSFMADRKRLKDLLERSKTRVDAQRKAKEAAAFRDKVTEENRKQREQKEAEEREKAARDSATRIIEHTLSDAEQKNTNNTKILPNDPCPCGSGKKYKFCCGIVNGADNADSVITEIDNGIPHQQSEQNNEDRSKADAVSYMIGRIGIGNVAYTEEFRKKLHDARWAYNALTPKQKTLVDHYSWLTHAEKEFKVLEKEAKEKEIRKKKRNRILAVVGALLAVCVIGVALFKTGLVSNKNHAQELSESFLVSAKQGDDFLFGKYEQDNNVNNGQEDIEWVVLGTDNGILTAISKYCIEDMPFNDAAIDSPTNWADSSIREWLNGDFYETAFSNDEKSIINQNHLSNPGNNYFDVDGGEDTYDYVFLIGKDTIESYYGDYKVGAVEFSWEGIDKVMTKGMSEQAEYEPLKAQYTEYAKKKYTEAEPQVDYDAVEKEYGKNSCFWWTRVTGDAQYSMFQIINSGGAMSVPAKANCGIRPVICINTEKSSNLQQGDDNSGSDNSDISVGGGWGDSDNGRSSYTIDQINSGILADTITFNSISDGKIGDEKNFVGAKASGEDVEYWNADSISVQDGETYTIRLYLHNNNPKGVEAVAVDVKTTFSLPTEVSTEHTIIGYLDSSNAQPSRYWDGVTLISDTPFFIEYVEGSAKFYNTKLFGIELDNDIITSGVLVGYDALDGRIPGGYEYDGVVIIDVVVHEFTQVE